MSPPSDVSASVVARTATEADHSAPVRTRGLTKRFGHQIAVDDVDLVVPAGAVYGFLGPNGSGKTTTIRMLLGLISPTSGTVDLLGAPMAGAGRSEVAVLRRVGALVEGPAFHPYLSGRANLRRLEAADPYADARTSSARVDAALDRVGLLVAARKRYRAYSLGMRQRLAIASALLVPRDLLVLDEPTNGLDPQGTREVRHLVSDLAADGTTVLVSSHLLSEVEQMCDHVGVMDAGRLVAQQPLAELHAGTAARVRVRTTAGGADPTLATLTALGLTAAERQAAPGDLATVTAALGGVELDRIVPALVAARVPVLGFEVVAASLEDVFVSLTGEGFEVSG
ncbi:ABC transporter ATP-binding protein [Microlunatus aurantiacus]|uniref:ABC transporter ATP-binding protein n=1 Tax=Microlunatus aurantiacus TaxID=446786 RepID=A0ABP7CNL3_9ACTN